jgi:hypothetical protein
MDSWILEVIADPTGVALPPKAAKFENRLLGPTLSALLP